MTTATLIGHLRQLSKVDGALARAFAERKKLEKELQEQALQLKKLEGERALKKKAFEEKRAAYLKEEKLLKEERDKISTRRKSLANLGAYKLQQAAEREIDFAAQQLEAKEEQTLIIIEEAEKAEQAFKASEEAVAQAAKNHETSSREIRETLAALEARTAEKSVERSSIVGNIDTKNLSIYERVREKFPGDAMVPVTKGSCPGCFIQVAPQLLVEISRGESLVKCRGCGRIIYVEESSSQASA